MKNKYFKELVQLFGCLYSNDEKKIHKFYSEYFSGKEFITLENNFINEFETNIYSILDNKGREAYLSKNIRLLYNSAYFEQFKNELKVITTNYETQSKRNKIIFELFLILWNIENNIKLYCNEFGINYNSLITKYETFNNVTLYDLNKIMFYIGGVPEPPQPLQNAGKTSASKKKTNKEIEIVKPVSKLFDLFKDPNQYHKVMELLIKENYCYETGIHKDKKRGHRTKLIQLIKALHTKGYFIGNKDPKDYEIKQILQKTFGCTVSIELIRKTKNDDSLFYFIPVPDLSEFF